MNNSHSSNCGYYTYLLECADGTYYCGWTTDPARRLAEHNNGTGSRYTRSRRPVRLVYLKSLLSRNEGMRLDAAIKKMSSRQKSELIQSVPDPDP